MVLASTTADYAELVGLLRSIPEASAYAEPIAAAAMQVRPEEARTFALLVAAVGQVETCWEKARGYVQQCGDWTLRAGRWVGSPHTTTVDAAPSGWRLPRHDDGPIVPGPYAMPDDGLGWGRGAMQIDHANAIGINWHDAATNILSGARILNAGLVAFPGRVDCALGAYNAGPAAIRRMLALGKSPDAATTGGDYVTRTTGFFRRWSLLVIP